MQAFPAVLRVRDGADGLPVSSGAQLGGCTDAQQVPVLPTPPNFGENAGKGQLAVLRHAQAYNTKRK
jgi:hypothetical protein